MRLSSGLRPYVEPAPLAALFLGMSSGFPFAMIGATLATRLTQHGITKSGVTAFALTFLAYNLKFLWAPVLDRYVPPILGRRRGWLLVTQVLGGPANYDGRSLNEAHAGLGIDSDDFNAVVGHLAAAMKDAGVPDDIIGRAGAAVVATEPDIVEAGSS